MMSMTYQAALREPMLDQRREREAIRGWQEKGDRAALELLLRSHARQAWSQASRFTDNPVHLEDLAAEGMLGLIRAADNFDQAQTVRFSTYSAWWVMNGISAALARTKAVIDVPSRIYVDAQQGKLSEEDRLLVRMAVQGTVPLDSSHRDEDEDRAPRDILVATEDGPEDFAARNSQRQALNRMLEEAMTQMGSEEIEVIRRRRLKSDPDSFCAIALDLGVSQARLRQVEKRAMLRLRRNLIDQGFNRSVLS